MNLDEAIALMGQRSAEQLHGPFARGSGRWFDQADAEALAQVVSWAKQMRARQLTEREQRLHAHVPPTINEIKLEDQR